MRKIILIFVIIAALFGAFFLFRKDGSLNQSIATKESSAATINANIPPAPKTDELPAKIATPLTNNIETKNLNANPDVQIIKATITEANGLQPYNLSVKAGIPVRLEIEPKDTIYGCMDTITMYDFFEDTWDVKAGQKIVMEFTPEEVGAYYLTCAMGVPWGAITVK